VINLSDGLDCTEVAVYAAQILVHVKEGHVVRFVGRGRVEHLVVKDASTTGELIWSEVGVVKRSWVICVPYQQTVKLFDEVKLKVTVSRWSKFGSGRRGIHCARLGKSECRFRANGNRKL
jgi:hypothetical protein